MEEKAGLLPDGKTLNFSNILDSCIWDPGREIRPRCQASSPTHGTELRLRPRSYLYELLTQIKTTEGQSAEDKESTVSGPHSRH